MAERVVGGFQMSSNYEVSIRKPLDARSLVPAYESLLIKDNWINSEGTVVAYNGMLVAVANTTDTSKNGIYFLFDPNCTSKLKSPNVEDESNWTKIGETSDISDFTTRLTNIESQLSDITDNLTDLDARISALENESHVETIGYRADFPVTGEPNKLYVAVDEQKSYVWVNNDYLPVGGSEYEEPTTIYGGDSGIE